MADGYPKLEYQVYEVFAQTTLLGHHEHQFSLLAGDPEMALALAQENFLRREDVISIWVVRRDHIVRSRPEAKRLLNREGKRYRMKQHYGHLADKWRRYKAEPLLPVRPPEGSGHDGAD